MPILGSHAGMSYRGWFGGRAGAGPWYQQQKITASDSAADDLFGSSVDINSSANTIIVGSPYDNQGANSDVGSAYVFTYNGSTWSEQQKLAASDASAGDQFGSSVAINASGNITIVGSPLDDIGANANVGSAYVFTYNGSTWSEQQKLTSSDAAAGDQFGSSLAINASGNIAIVGAPLEEDSGPSTQQEGAAYVFTYNGSTWSQQQKLKPSIEGLNFNFGSSIAINDAGNIAVISAPGQGNVSVTGGAAYIFTYNGSTWSEQEILRASDGLAGDNFGSSVSINAVGNTVIIGSFADDISNTDQGSAYIFTYDGAVWSQYQKIIASDATDFSRFGNSVAMDSSGAYTVVGASGALNANNVSSGACYIFSKT